MELPASQHCQESSGTKRPPLSHTPLWFLLVPHSCSLCLDPSLISCGNAPGIFLEISHSRQLLLEINPVQGFEGVSCVLSLKATAEYFLEMWGQPGECTYEFTLLPLQKGTCRRAHSVAWPQEGASAAMASTLCLLPTSAPGSMGRTVLKIHIRYRDDSSSTPTFWISAFYSSYPSTQQLAGLSVGAQ